VTFDARTLSIGAFIFDLHLLQAKTLFIILASASGNLTKLNTSVYLVKLKNP
jgi:hypothetical protein